MNVRVHLWTGAMGLLAHAALAQDNVSGIYVIDAQNTDIRLLVYRAGAFSRLGHNHVISVGEVNGAVTVDTEQPERSRFELEIPVKGLVVDDPLLREEEGEDFSSELSEDDIAGTRRNLLGERVLDAEKFPTVRVTGSGPTGEGRLALSLEMLGDATVLSVPADWSLDEGVLEVSGSFPLTHGQLGMRPFRALIGTLRVAEAIGVRYRVRAVRAR